MKRRSNVPGVPEVAPVLLFILSTWTACDGNAKPISGAGSIASLDSAIPDSAIPNSQGLSRR